MEFQTIYKRFAINREEWKKNSSGTVQSSNKKSFQHLSNQLLIIILSVLY